MNKIEVCFELINTYNENLERLIRNNYDSEDKLDEKLENGLNNIIEALKNDENIILSINKKYESGKNFEEFCIENKLDSNLPNVLNFHGSLYAHQERAIQSILNEKCTIISTGTGSGKTESFLIPIFNYCLNKKSEKGVKSIIIYPMNALATDQLRRIEDAAKNTDITYGIINGDVPFRKDVKSSSNVITREDIIENPPDILVTNYVMLERMLTNKKYDNLFDDVNNVFKYIVLDEIHVYNGNKALNIKYLLHRLRYRFSSNNNIVQIGCSATLDRNSEGEKTGGYITGKKGIDEFIQNMFDVKEKEYEYIQPTFSKKEPLFMNIKDKEYLDMLNNPVIKILKEILYDGSKTFDEIIDILKEKNLNVSKKELKDLLNKVVNLNEKYPNNPILDFRIHLFFLERENEVKRCCKCGKYYTSNIERCNDCGNLVFPVYKRDINLLMGTLEKGYIYPFNNNNGNIVFLNFNDKISYDCKNKLKFINFETIENKIKLDIEKDGCYEVIKDESMKFETINLFKEDEELYKTDLEYQIIRKNLMYMPYDNRKILVFKDNREKSGRNSNIYNDFFFSSCYDEILKLVLNGKSKSLTEALEEGIELINEYNENSDCKDINAEDFKCWFFRFIKKSGKLLSKFETSYNLNDEEKELVNIAYENSLYLHKTLSVGTFIKLNRFDFIKPKGLKVDADAKINKDKSYISLTDKGRLYDSFIERLGNEKIIKLAKELVKKDIFIEENDLFYLNPKNIKISNEKSNYNSISEILENIKFKAGVHTSEVNREERKKYEKDFQQGKLNLLFATPTLEMGIDIGNLSFVYMLGVPPISSNYCQRAGRAGRKNDKFAAIITICSESNSHDWYYFHNPKEIIEGTINPPRFKLNNKMVLNKHVNTIIYKNSKILPLKETCEKVFNCKIDINEHIRLLKAKLAKKKTGDCYTNAIYPDYNFSSEVVTLYNKTDEILATRELDIGYKTLNIKSYMFIGNKHYYLKPKEDKSFISMQGEKVIDIQNILCEEDLNYMQVKRVTNIKNCFLNVKANKKLEPSIKKGPIEVYYIPDGIIEYIAKYKEEIFGYTLKTNIILFKFHNNILNKKQTVSLLALLHKSIMKEFGLDSSELALIADEAIKTDFIANEESSNCSYGIMYDKNANGNFDLEVILNAIKKNTNNFLDNTYEIISNCKCEKDSGCYLCLKSFETQYLYNNLNKYSAKNMVGYLMGKEKLKPSITITRKVLYVDAEMNLVRKGDKFKLTINGDTIDLENKESQNETIFYGLYTAIKKLYEDDIESIVFSSNLEYVIKVIKEEESCKKTSSLDYFYFYKQAFTRFDA